jgi:hypothetical protein
MESIIPRLYASAPEPLGFGPSLEIRAFLLQSKRGNLLIYRAATLEQDVADLGGIARQYLNHHHEASPACDWVASTFHAPLHVHEADARAVSEVCNVDETFSERHKLDEDFEIIPIPGHTSGATAFLWDTGQHRALFTGDTVFFIRGRWRAAVLDGVSDWGALHREPGADPHPRFRLRRARDRASGRTLLRARREAGSRTARSSSGCDAARVAERPDHETPPIGSLLRPR